jgi:hypothetical protein
MTKYHFIMKNVVWQVVLILEGESMMSSKSIYKIKHDVDESIEKYKEIFVSRGFPQKEGE